MKKGGGQGGVLRLSPLDDRHDGVIGWIPYMGDVTHINNSPSKAEPKKKLEEVGPDPVPVLAAPAGSFPLMTTFAFDDSIGQDTEESLGCRRRTAPPCRAWGAS